MEDQMLNKQQFVKIINFCIRQDQKDEDFSNALQAYTEDKDFTGFFRQDTSKILNFLEDIMGDTTSLISWWYYDNDKGSNNLECVYTVTHQEENRTYSKLIPTPEDLYDTLMFDTEPLDSRYDYLHYGFAQQTQGVKFAISVIDQLIQKNTSTENDGYEARNALLELVRSKIHTEYLTASGDSFPLTYPLDGYSLLRKEEHE